IYQMLSEESPLDMTRLFGEGAGVLTPDPWLRDNSMTLERLLKLIRSASVSAGPKGHASLYQLLRSINSLSRNGEPRERRADGDEDPAGPIEDDLIELPFPNDKVFEISERAFMELLLRSRKRLVLAQAIRGVSASTGAMPDKRLQPPPCC